MNGRESHLSLAEIGAAMAIVERELVAGILSHVPAGIRLAAEQGVDSGSIEQQDYRLIFRACEVCADDGTDAALALAKLALIRFGLWDGSWTDQSLVAMAMLHWGRESPVRESAAALRTLWEEWERGGSIPPTIEWVADGVWPIRVGLVIARLADLSDVPPQWLHDHFRKIRARRDGIAAARVGPKPIAPAPARGAAA